MLLCKILCELHLTVISLVTASIPAVSRSSQSLLADRADQILSRAKGVWNKKTRGRASIIKDQAVVILCVTVNAQESSHIHILIASHILIATRQCQGLKALVC